MIKLYSCKVKIRYDLKTGNTLSILYPLRSMELQLFVLFSDCFPSLRASWQYGEDDDGQP